MDERVRNFLESNGVMVSSNKDETSFTIKNGSISKLTKLVLKASSKCFDEIKDEKSPIPAEKLKSDTVRVILKHNMAEISDISELEIKNEKDVEFTRNVIKNRIKEFYPNSPFQLVTPNLIAMLISEYDNLFFSGIINRKLEENDLGILAIASKSLTKTAGTASRKKKDLIVKISATIMNNITKDNAENLFGNKDESVKTRLNALMEIVEHELIHILQMLDKNFNCLANHHGEWFKKYSKQIFFHTKCTHMLIEEDPFIEKSDLKKEDLKLGDNVSFITKNKDKTFCKNKGKIIKLNPKKAKVFVDIGLSYSVSYAYLTKM